MVKNERMGGFVPSWQPPERNSAPIESHLGKATQTAQNALTSEMLLSYAPESSAPPNTAQNRSDNSFGFSDLLDMINPLQHVPLLNVAYREFTGDSIKPISQIIGGAVFGGAIGLAGGIANAIAVNETGKDIGANLTAIAFRGNAHAENPVTFNKTPEKNIEMAIKHIQKQDDMTNALLAFTDLANNNTEITTTKSHDKARFYSYNT